MAVDPLVGSAILGAGSTVMQGAASIFNARRTNYRNVQNWHMQNEYNSPKNQMKRFQEAGLNPNLIYGQGNSGNAGNVSSAPTPDTPDMGKNIGNFLALKQAKAQLDLTNQQVENAVETRRLISNQADKAFFEQANLNYGDIDNQYGQFTLEGMKRKNELLKQEAFGKQIDNSIKDTTKAQAIKKIFWEAEMAEQKYEGQELNNALLQLQKEFLNLGLDRNSPWYAKIFGNIINKVNK